MMPDAWASQNLAVPADRRAESRVGSVRQRSVCRGLIANNAIDQDCACCACNVRVIDDDGMGLAQMPDPSQIAAIARARAVAGVTPLGWATGRMARDQGM